MFSNKNAYRKKLIHLGARLGLAAMVVSVLMGLMPLMPGHGGAGDTQEHTQGHVAAAAVQGGGTNHHMMVTDAATPAMAADAPSKGAGSKGHLHEESCVLCFMPGAAISLVMVDLPGQRVREIIPPEIFNTPEAALPAWLRRSRAPPHFST